MGVVYSSDQLERGELPGIGDHLLAAEFVRTRVSELGGVVLTLVHGSVVEDRSTIRSDLDVLVTYEYDSPEEEPKLVDNLKAVFDEARAATNVHIEASAWPAHEHPDARAERMYDILFSRHLARAMSDPYWSVGKPDEAILAMASIDFTPEQLRTVLLNYTTYKHAGFVKAPRRYSDTDASSLTAMQRVLEFPKSTGRKLGQLDGSRRDAALGDYQSEFEGADIGEHLLEVITQLRRIDSDYTALLNHMKALDDLAPDDVDDYRAWLADRYPRALNLGIQAASGFVGFVGFVSAS